MIHLYLNDTSPFLSVWEEILAAYGNRISESCLWAAAREYGEMPHFGNLYQQLVIERLVQCLCDELGIEPDSELLDVQYCINAVATSFSINGTVIYSTDDWDCVLAEMQEPLTDAA